MNLQKLFLTFFYSGLSPYAPGTAGSILAGFIGFVILQYFHTDTLFLLTILITLIAIAEINKYEARTSSHDDKSIVIDEVVGLWLAFVLSSTTITQMLLSFVFFRIFDIWKPSLIGKIDKNVKGGLGVMGDDILAGILAGICSAGSWQAIEYIIGHIK
ncbi:MAG: phosphatidylglycerophosphatase A [Sulfurospirillum sp.]